MKIKNSIFRISLAFLSASLLIVSGMVTSNSSFAAEVPFAVRYSVTTRGTLDIIGNTNRSTSTTLFDVDSDSGTTNSTTADLTVPAGASVLFAGLYWTGTSSNLTTRANVKFKAPGSSSYTTLTADTAAVDNNVINYYSHFKDVTATVTSAGAGTYAVADIVSNSEMGWILVVVFSNQAETPRTIVVYDGSLRVSSGVGFSDRSIAVSNFLTPPTGTVNATVGLFSVQGQDNIPGDGAIFAGATLSDSLNPSNNYFNGTYTKFGAHLTNKNPDTNAHNNIDMDLVAVNGVLGNSVTSTTFRFTSSGDFYIPSVLTVTIDTYEPSFSSNFKKGVVDVNAGTIDPGDTLYYEFVLKNSGNDPATHVVFSDIVPTGLTYLPGTLEILSGTGTGVLTDAASDDRGEVSGSSVTVRLGTGATASAGGTMQAGDEVKVRFAAVVGALSNGTSLSNAASLSYMGLSSGASYTSQSEAIIGGAVGDSLVFSVGSAQPTPAFSPFTQQGTATPTRTATPAITATRTPTSTATVVATATAVATATTVATSTATPAPTATVPPTSIGGEVRDTAGNVVPFARVIIAGLGEVLTDQNGVFLIGGAVPGTSYSIVVQKTGVEFATGSLTAQPGTFLTVRGTQKPFNQNNCPQKDLTTILVSSSRIAQTLKEDSVEKLAKLRDARKQFVLLNGEKVSAAELSDRVVLQFTSYQNSSKLFPEIALTCTGIAACQANDLRARKTAMLLELDNLSHESLLVTRVLRERGRITAKKAAVASKAVKKSRASGKRLVRSLSNQFSVCP